MGTIGIPIPISLEVIIGMGVAISLKAGSQYDARLCVALRQHALTLAASHPNARIDLGPTHYTGAEGVKIGRLGRDDNCACGRGEGSREPVMC